MKKVVISSCLFFFYFYLQPISQSTVFGLYNRCNSTENCTKISINTTCMNNICVCLSGFANVNNRCIKQVTVNHSCSSDGECEAFDFGSQCLKTNHTCQCKLGYIRQGIHCVKRGSPNGGMCSSTYECQRIDPNSHCANYLCQCNPGYDLTGSGCKEKPSRLLDSCYRSTQCRMYDYHSVCRQEKCNCSVGFQLMLAAPNYYYCKPIVAQINGTCHFNQECKNNDQNSICSGNLVKHCICPKGINKKTGKCNSGLVLIPHVSLLVIALCGFARRWLYLEF
ncbi:prion-like-(Q/N-rich) domain-bearing protein 25 [Dinothrombium tinctorium]|uniref:Prion-like-(Q/N-rich) domain-bearing protein 25 n=1 Tax=Dinothrombium tinctorium TaxID=1965070 RepID=A0A443Q8H4_9ACAR|nr:prion-like-(Q/N-rich) domain-bearing protein 25 [Dinothrombium tinctorium]